MKKCALPCFDGLEARNVQLFVEIFRPFLLTLWILSVYIIILHCVPQSDAHLFLLSWGTSRLRWVRNMFSEDSYGKGLLRLDDYFTATVLRTPTFADDNPPEHSCAIGHRMALTPFIPLLK